MNSVKTILVVAVLAAVAYMVYMSLNNNPADNPPMGVPQDATGPVPIQIPETGQTLPQSVATGGGAAPVSGYAPNGSAAPGTPPTASIVSATTGSRRVSPMDTTGSGGPGSATPPAGGSGDRVSPPYVSPGYSGQAVGEGPRTIAPPPGHTEPSTADVSNTLKLRSDNMKQNNPLVASGMVSPPASGPRREFSAFMQSLQQKLDAGHLDEALLALSSWHNDPRLSPEETRQVEQLLDQLAGTVVYSRQYHLEKPYEVRPGDTLQRIAQQYDVPVQLLGKINGIRDPNDLQPGQKLKVVRGPFKAVVSLSRYELKLMLNGRYAGRFSIGVGRDHQTLEGSYEVRNKTVNPAYYDRNNQAFGPEDPQNPLGKYLIGLDNNLSIHGTNNPENVGRAEGQGCIRLRAGDIEDLHDILSVGSLVIIRR